MTDYSRYAEPEKDLVKPGARYMKRAADERDKTRARMDAVDPGESTRRMNAARVKEGKRQ
jgi:hypothetical protein